MIRINDSKSKTTLKAAVLVSVLLLFAAATGFGQQVVNLTAGATTAALPDGTVVPMWGYTCQALAAGAASTATCAPLSGANPAYSAAAAGALGGIYVLNGGSGYSSTPSVTVSAPTGVIAGVTNAPATATAVVSGGQIVGFNVTSSGKGYIAPPTVTITDATGTGAVAAAAPAWSPVVITVPYGAAGGLQINLTNNLSFTPAAGGTANNIPTSVVIVGLVGGGLGSSHTTTASPNHSNAQGCVTWFIASGATPPGTPCPSPQAGASGTPPVQGPRVQSMATEVAAVAPGTVAATALTWANLRPGTYLLESGTHPSIQVPMGFIGMVVVTTAPASAGALGTAYPAWTPPTTNAAAQVAVPAVQYNAEVPLEFSEIDPVQNKEADLAVRTAGFSETAVWSGMNNVNGSGAVGCGQTHTCYPPAVNYTPFYFLINGQAFNKTNPAASLFPATAGGTPAAPVTTGIPNPGTLLVRMVNAGLRMHVPSIVNSQTTGFNGSGASGPVAGFTLIAEDGNPLPNLAAPRVQTDLFMAAGKTNDVMINTAQLITTAIPVYDRALNLSANSSVRDAGMLAYIGVNGAALPVSAGTGVFAAAQANPDTYDSIVCPSTAASCTSLVITDPSKGVIGNDINVYGVALSSPPSGGTLICNALPGSPVAGICANGTFTYTPNPGTTADSFGYCANGAAAGTAGLCTTVTLGASTLSGNPTAIAQVYTSKMASYLKIPSPGLLLGNTDPSNLTLNVVVPATAPTVTLSGGASGAATVVMDADGGFVLSVPGNTSAGTATFSYTVQNSQGRQSAAAGTVTVTLPQPSNLQVKVVDAQAYNNCNLASTCIAGLAPITDYRWIIEEDQTFWVDPNCTTNSSINTPGCPSTVGPAGVSSIPVFGVQFHTSAMPYVAQGCTGPLSCEGGQTMLDTRPACTAPGVPAGCSSTAGQHIAAVCDVGNGACRPDPNAGTVLAGYTEVNPSEVVLDPSKRYYISVLPGDAANPFPSYAGQPICTSTPYTSGTTLNTQCGHTMSGAPIPPACNILGGPNACTTGSAFTQPVTVLALPTPLPTGKLSVIVFEDDFPLNGEQDGGGGNGTVAPIEPGLGGFNVVLWDTFGGLGDVTGQDTYDMFNQPLSNGLAGSVDPITGLDACPISATATTGPNGAGFGVPGAPQSGGITGMIVTCPKYEADGATLSPLAGQAVIYNLMPEKFSVQAYPGADRIARGEEWLQTNTLDGQHPHDSFIRIGEPSYFQEYGPAGYHVAIGFANPAIINARANDVCAGSGTSGAVGPCTNTIDGQVDVQRLSRTPDQRLYASGTRDALTWTQCWVSLGDPDGEDFMFTKCDAQGNFKFSNVPGGNWRLTIGDQWNDQIIDGLSTPANVGCVPKPPASTCSGGLSALHLGNIGVQQWQANLYTRVFIDDNKNGIPDPGEIGIPFLYTRIYYRDGHNANGLNTDFNGVANFNETFPLFNWYVVEADSTRYKTTGIHTVYDAGGPADGSTSCGNGTTARQCGKSTAYNFLANTYEAVPLPADLSVPGAVYCALADCKSEAASFFALGKANASSSTASTGRIDPPWVNAEGWSGMTSQGNWIEFGKAPYAACPPACATVPNAVSNPTGGTTASTTQVAENGGIHGQVSYASTRPFDDASQMILQPWEPLVPGVTVNLYQEGFAADGVTPTLKMVDTTVTSSWDAWAQGFYPGSSAGSGTGAGLKPYLNCPGQGTNVAGSPNQDLFFFSLYDQPNYLDWYNGIHSTPQTAPHALPYNAQYKCYDAMHIWNQLQPAPYDGEYSFPSVLGINPTTGKQITPTGYINPITGSAPAMAGTNCTICVPNPDATDLYRVGAPMLPPGKYVLEVIMPPGFEVYKEEDKNLLIGDNYIAPVTQEFGGLGGFIFIIPDQASVASMYDESASGYNPNNFQDQTTALGLSQELSGVPGYPGFQDPVWPCVGEQRVVPDFLSLFPRAQEVAPFAGAIRPLCDRKEVALGNQMSVRAHFAIYTSTHVASKYTGVITDDFTSEFDPFAPQFGEKFAPPNLPISTRDYLGNEISRVYSDHWGVYDGLTFSSWEVNPPNITGYSPTIMVQCMNDPGPIVDTRATIPNPNGSGTIANPNFGQLVTDPLYNPAYSDFCYEEPYMPGLTNYTDTPVVPTQAFVGAGYNNVDCSYPDATPAIKEVDSQDGIGPWVQSFGHTITITALGNMQVNNTAYSGPSATVAPFDMKTVNRHYGFGGTAGTVTVGGVPLTNVSWSDTTITGTVNQTGTVNGAPVDVPFCEIQQQAQYGGAGAWCGQLVITAANGKQSIDAVTVTIAGKAPMHINATASVQAAIDGAQPGDLLIVDPTCQGAAGVVPCTTTGVAGGPSGLPAGATASQAAHSEMLLMWKPVRLQGVGAVSSVISANANPAGKLLDPWRRHVNCLFGLTLSGVPTGTPAGSGGKPAVYDSTGTYNCPDTGWVDFVGQVNNPQIDRLPLEAVIGWDATLNGNLAEQLQEPSLMGAYEGAGITVLGKGVDVHGANPWNDGNEGGAFPTVTTLLTGVGPDPVFLPVGDANPLCTDGTSANGAANGSNRFPSNFMCNPSSIDGLTITNSSQGGGGIFAHGWAHHLQIANNRIYNNAGTLTGGISVGQGEFPTPQVMGSTTNSAPSSCSDGTGFVANQHLPYCLQMLVNVHNNYVTNNSSLGDELFSGTLSGGGGVTFCTGNDYYKFNYNFVCGNLSSGEGGGLVHLGEIQNGDIEHNSFVFNQSQNPTIPTNGGGIQIMGTPDTDPVCGTQIDADCPPGLSDGTGHGLVINANLIQGNMSESGSGGGIRLQQVNGSEVSTFPTKPSLWNSVAITNNIIVNNVAGWDGAGISLQDALNVQIVNNTIAHNDTLASSGVLTQSIGTPDASAPAGNCVQNGPTGPTTASCPQSSGLTSTPNSSVMTTSFTGLTLTCPFGNHNCAGFSNPAVLNNLITQNRAFYIGITAAGTGTQNQQNLVGLFTMSGAAAPAQASTGACSNTDSYWDIGVRGDTGPGNHNSGFTLNPQHTLLSTGGGSAPRYVSQYCNGSRVPPECSVADGCGGPSGFGVPPGIVDASAPNPVFSLVPSATVDEGNNWINVSWGPLTLSDPSIQGTAPAGGTFGNYGGGLALGNYSEAADSPTIDAIPATETVPAGVTVPATDFNGNPRPDPANPNRLDYGAVEFQGTPTTLTATLTSISPNSGLRGTSVNVTLTGTNLTGASAINVSGGAANGITVTGIGVVSSTTVVATFTISPAAPIAIRNVTVTTPVGTTNNVTFSVTALTPTLTSISPTFGERGTTVGVTLTGTNLTGATALTMSGSGPITCTITGTPTATSLTANCAIPLNASRTIRSVTVTTPNGSGTLNGAFQVTGATISFAGPVGMTTGGTGTKNGTIIVTNTSAGAAGSPLTITATSIAKNSGAGTFSITGGTCVPTGGSVVVAEGANCTILVQYVTGGSTAIANATVTLTDTEASTGGGAASVTQTRSFNAN